MMNSILKLLILFSASTSIISSCKSADESKVVLRTPLDSLQYYQGIFIGIKLREAGYTNFDEKLFEKAVDSLTSSSFEPSSVYEKAQENVTFLIAKQNHERELLELKVLEENKKKKNVITTPSGLQYVIIKQGSGARPRVGDDVNIKMIGKRVDGIVFTQRDGITNFSGRIPGLQEGLQLMPKGSKYKFYLHPDLAYGSNPVSMDGKFVRPNMVAIYEIELTDIIPNKK